MLKEMFLGHSLSHSQINKTVKAFIISEAIFWSAWNLGVPIFAIFAANTIPGGSIEVASTVVSVYLIIRVFWELLTGKILRNSTMAMKLAFTLVGMSLVGISFLGFVFASNVPMLFIFYSLAGFGMGLSAPSKNTIFSTHLDKHSETTEWGVYDAAVFIGMAISTAIGGFIANTYGFHVLFFISAVFIFLSISPYLLFIYNRKILYQSYKM